MMNFLIIPLLLMGMECIPGHSIKKLEIGNKTQAVIYEIKEDSAAKTTVFVNPKAEKPTLREIIYYHIVERPYEGRVRYDSEEGPEIDETMRPFTNSHGLPFLESFDKEHDPIIDNNDLKEELHKEIHEKEAELPKDVKDDVAVQELPENVEVVYYDEDEMFGDDKMDKDEGEEISTPAPEVLEEISTEANRKEYTVSKEIPTEAVKADATESALVEATTEIVTETSFNPETTTEPVTEAYQDEETTIQEDMGTESVIEITPTTTEEPVFAQKAKTARKLLFDRVKERYISIKSNETQTSSPPSERRKRQTMNIPEAPRLGKMNYDSLPPFLRKLLSSRTLKARINSESESDEEERLDDIKNRMNKMISKLKTKGSSDDAEKPRTYGMNLTADTGYVWNDMVNPKIRHKVEGSDWKEIKELLSSDERREEDEQEDLNYKKEDEELPTSDEKEEEHKQEEPEFKKEEEKNGSSEEKKIEDDKEPTEDKQENGGDSFEEKGRRRNNHKDKEDLMTQLMENEQFWKWLADWTSVYMDVLTEHIKEAVKEEVAIQIKKQKEEKNEDTKPVKPETSTQEPIKDNNIVKPEESDKESDTTSTTSKPAISDTEDPIKEDIDTTPKPDSDNKTEDEKESASDKKGEDFLKRYGHNNDKKKKDETPINDNKRKKDETPINEELTKNNTKEEKSYKDKDITKIEAQNVYGNTIGGEKVSNIFIFYAKQDPDKVLQDISKLNNSNVDVDIRINVPDIDKKEVDNKKDDSTQTPAEKNKDSIGTSSSSETPKDLTTGVPIHEKEELTSTTENPKVILTTEIPKEIDDKEESTTLPVATTEEPEQKSTESEPKTESDKVESTTEKKEEEISKDRKENADKSEEIKDEKPISTTETAALEES